MRGEWLYPDNFHLCRALHAVLSSASQMEKIKEIEDRYPVEEIEINGLKGWPYLRTYFAAKYVYGREPIKASGRVFGVVLRSFFYGFWNWFGRYDYIVMTSSTQRRDIDGQYVERCDTVDERLGKVLFIELPSPKHYPRRAIPTPHPVSKIPLYLLVLLYSKLLSKSSIRGHEVFNKIKEETGVVMSMDAFLLKFYAQYKIGKLLVKIYKPKALFLTVTYTNIGYIRAFKEAGVKVVELQHGLIAKEHTDYNVYKDIDSRCYPDYLLTFGEYERSIFGNHNFYISNDRVLPIGHFYLDYIDNLNFQDTQFQGLVSSYKRVIAVTSQNNLEDQLLQFLFEACQLLPETAFIFVHRRTREYYDRYDFPRNLIFADWLNCYQVMVLADLHTTMYSTCAIESLALGKANVLINIEGMARACFEEQLGDESLTKFVDSPAEFADILNTWQLKSREEIKSQNQFIKSHYKENLDRALHTILA